MSFNLHVFFQSFAVFITFAGVIFSIIVVVCHRWLPLRMLAALCSVLLMACMVALLFP